MLNKFSIAKRLALGFGIVLALLIAVAFSGYWGMESVTNETISMLHGDQAISQKSEEVKIEMHRMEYAAAKLSDGHRKTMSTKDVTISDFAKRTSIVMVIVVLVTFGVATLVTVLVSGGITRPVKAMAAHLLEMAQGGGDLTKRIDIHSHDEGGQMASS